MKIKKIKLKDFPEGELFKGNSSSMKLLEEVHCYAHLGVCDGQSINPDPPPSPFVFDGVVEQDPKDVVNHLGYFLLLWILGVDVSEGEHPVLPHGALQQAAGPQHKQLHLTGL